MKKILLLHRLVASMAFGGIWRRLSVQSMTEAVFVTKRKGKCILPYAAITQASTANKQDPLWNHSFGADVHGVYANSTTEC